MDEIAKRLGMDPVEIRMKNIFIEGDTSYWGEQLHAVGLKNPRQSHRGHRLGEQRQREPGVKIGKGFAVFRNRRAHPPLQTQESWSIAKAK